MVLIGWEKPSADKDVGVLFAEHEVMWSQHPFTTDGFRFAAIETASMRNNSLCCLGRANAFLETCAGLIDKPCDPFFLQAREKLERDMVFWKNFLADLTRHLGRVAVMRYYPQTNVKTTVREWPLSLLDAQLLMQMDINEVLILS